MRPWPSDVVAFGGDYNPEQWPESVWDQDYELFDTAGINTVTLGWLMEQTPSHPAGRDVEPVKPPGVLRLWSG